MSGRRVLILPKWYPWDDRPVHGLFCREQARAAALHSDVRVLAFRPEPMRGARLYRWTVDEQDDPVSLRLVYRRPRIRAAAMATQLAGMRAALRALARTGWRPDVIHAHVFEAGFPAVLLGRHLGCPVVVSEHFTAFQRGLVRGSDRLVARACFRHADLVCPVSEDLRRQLEKVEPRGRYRVIPNVVDTDVFHPAEPSSPRAAGSPLRLLNVAALAEKKRHSDLLEALARLRRKGMAAELEIVGDGELRPALESMAERLGLADAVRFLGSRPPHEVADRMRAADVFVLPSRFENLPVVLLEAMACGLPAVATAVGGVPEVVDDAAGALVAPGDVAALAAGIEAVAARLDRFDARALADRARSRYGAEALGATWADVYEEVSRSPARAAPARRRSA